MNGGTHIIMPGNSRDTQLQCGPGEFLVTLQWRLDAPLAISVYRNEKLDDSTGVVGILNGSPQPAMVTYLATCAR